MQSCLLLCLAVASFLASPPIFGQTNVWMLTPGFTVREFPLKISNINNLRLTPDGKLTALGYDGRVHILRDPNGDGLEDEDTLFWDKPTLSVPVGMIWATNGLYVSSRGKISLLRDTDGDGKADRRLLSRTGLQPMSVRVAYYLYGSQVSEKTLRINPPSRVGASELGNWNAKGFPENDPFMIRNFSGAMDEFCLFSRALDASEIRALYSQGKPQSDSAATH